MLLYVNPIGMSRLPKLEVSSAGKIPSTIDTEVVAVFQDASKKVLAPKGAGATIVGRLKKNDAFSARAGAVEVLRFGGTKDIDVVLAGLGVAAELTEEKVRVAGGNTWARLKAQKAK